MFPSIQEDWQDQCLEEQNFILMKRHYLSKANATVPWAILPRSLMMANCTFFGNDLRYLNS